MHSGNIGSGNIGFGNSGIVNVEVGQHQHVGVGDAVTQANVKVLVQEITQGIKAQVAKVL